MEKQKSVEKTDLNNRQKNCTVEEIVNDDGSDNDCCPS